MKKAMAFVFVLGLTAFVAACGGGRPAAPHKGHDAHSTAPAHASVSEPAPAAAEAATQQAAADAPAGSVKYTCAMHPEVISDKPGRCPKCGMTLEPVGPPAAGGDVTPTAGTAGGLVNVNTATLAELDAVSGIGEATAKKIIAYREAHGPLRSVDDLKAAGIHGCVLGRIKSQLTFTGGGTSAAGSQATGRATGSPAAGSGARTNINAATAAQIKAAVSRMPQATADAIVAARQTAGNRFSSWGEIDAVPGVGPTTLERLNAAFDLK